MPDNISPAAVKRDQPSMVSTFPSLVTVNLFTGDVAGPCNTEPVPEKTEP